MQRRNILFSAKSSEDREEWISHIRKTVRIIRKKAQQDRERKTCSSMGLRKRLEKEKTRTRTTTSAATTLRAPVVETRTRRHTEFTGSSLSRRLSLGDLSEGSQTSRSKTMRNGQNRVSFKPFVSVFRYIHLITLIHLGFICSNELMQYNSCWM